MSDFADKVRSLSYLSGGRPRDTRTREGRHHPETGVPYKITETEAGRTVEHNTKNDRVDATAYVDTIRAHRDPDTGRIFNA